MFRSLRVGGALAAGLMIVAAGGAQSASRVLAAPGSVPRPVAAAWLEGVSATSGRNVWAVGAFGRDYGKNGVAHGAEPLIAHWNGRSWTTTRIGLRNFKGYYGYFAGVAATSATSAWAAGGLLTQYAWPWIDQWDGTAWKQDLTPIVGPDDGTSDLSGVAAASRGSAWAVGDYYAGPGEDADLTLILRWSGTRWRRVPSPNPAGAGSGARNALRGVAAQSPADAWAVGAANSGPSGQRSTLIEHWDGAAWTAVPSPDPSLAGCVRDELLGVAASPAATWAVGDYCGAALVLRLEDGQWQQVPAPRPPAGLSENLASVAVTSATNAWTVGSVGSRVLILRWNGKEWATAHAPDPAGATSAKLAGVTAVSRSSAWAVGQADYPGHVIRLLIERWNGTRWTLVSVPNPPG